MARIVWAVAPVEMGRWVAAVVGHVGTGTTKADEEGGLDSAQKGDWETNLETNVRRLANMEGVTFGAGTSKERWVVCCAVGPRARIQAPKVPIAQYCMSSSKNKMSDFKIRKSETKRHTRNCLLRVPELTPL